MPIKRVRVLKEIYGKTNSFTGLKKVNVAFQGRKVMRSVKWHEDYGRFGKAQPFVVIKKRRYGLME